MQPLIAGCRRRPGALLWVHARNRPLLQEACLPGAWPTRLAWEPRNQRPKLAGSQATHCWDREGDSKLFSLEATEASSLLCQP